MVLTVVRAVVGRRDPNPNEPSQAAQPGFMVAGVVFGSLVWLVIAASPAEALPQSREQNASRDGSQKQDPGKTATRSIADAGAGELYALVKPNTEELVIELGRSRLLRFPAGIRRSALSSTDVSEVVQVGPKELLVFGRRPGTADLTVWPAALRAVPAVIVVRVERKLRREE